MVDPGLVRVTSERLSVDAYLGVHDAEQRQPRTISTDAGLEYPANLKSMYANFNHRSDPVIVLHAI